LHNENDNFAKAGVSAKDFSLRRPFSAKCSTRVIRNHEEDRPGSSPACKNMLIIIISITVMALMIVAANAQQELNERGGCPECGFFVPLFRRPKSLRQALWGGWTCDQCGTEMDRRGRALYPA